MRSDFGRRTKNGFFVSGNVREMERECTFFASGSGQERASTFFDTFPWKIQENDSACESDSWIFRAKAQIRSALA